MKRFFASFILILAVGTCLLAGYKLYVSLSHPIKYKSEILASSREFDLDPSLIASVINVESSYRPHATSSKGAIGLMQIKLSTAQYLMDEYNIDDVVTLEDLYTPKTNIYYGCMYLRYLFDKFDNTTTTLASYNAGETCVRSWLNDSQYSLDQSTLTLIPYPETEEYIQRINENICFYSKIY